MHTDSLRPAKNLLEKYARSEDREMLRDFYFADDRRVESARLALEESQTMAVELSPLYRRFIFR